MRLEHLLSRALVLAKCTPKKEDEETFGFKYEDYITLAVNLKKKNKN